MPDFKIKKSPIHGKGVFATKNLAKNQIIGTVIKYKYIFFPVISYS